MAIKFSVGKLELGQPFEELFPHQLENNSIEILAITVEHLKAVCSLPFHHRDPFDRLIIAQSQIEKLPIISKDTIFDRYGVKPRVVVTNIKQNNGLHLRTPKKNSPKTIDVQNPRISPGYS